MDNEYYKYISFETAKIILSNLTIRFSRPSCFNDIYDCEPPFNLVNFTDKDFQNCIRKVLNVKNIHNYQNIPVNDIAINMINGIRDNINKCQRVLCLSKKKDCILMWSHYAQNHTGIVIGFDKNYKFLKNSKEVKYSKLPKNIGGYILKDFNNKKELKDEFEKLLLTKYQDWQYENEVRSFFSTELLYQYFCEQSIDNRYKNYTKQLKNNENFIDLPIAKECIKSIYLGVNMNIIAIDEIIALAKNINNSINIYRAKKSNNSYKIMFEKLF